MMVLVNTLFFRMDKIETKNRKRDFSKKNFPIHSHIIF